MYKINKRIKTSLIVNQSTEGETIEMKMERIVNNKEPIKDGAPLIYTERKDGIIPAYDIRTDRWEIAIDAMNVAEKVNTSKREARIVKLADGKTEPTQGQAIQGGETTD
jgi:hypothetical protein